MRPDSDYVCACLSFLEMPCVLRDCRRPRFTKIGRLILLMEALVRGKGIEPVEDSAGAMKCGEILVPQFSNLKIRMILTRTPPPKWGTELSITLCAVCIMNREGRHKTMSMINGHYFITQHVLGFQDGCLLKIKWKNEAARIQLTDNGTVNFVWKILVMLEDPDHHLSVIKVAFVMDDQDVTCIRSTNSHCAVPSIPGRIVGGEDGPREEHHVAQRMCVWCPKPLCGSLEWGWMWQEIGTIEKTGYLNWPDNLIKVIDWLVLCGLADLKNVWPWLSAIAQAELGDAYEGGGEPVWISQNVSLKKKKNHYLYSIS